VASQANVAIVAVVVIKVALTVGYCVLFSYCGCYSSDSFFPYCGCYWLSQLLWLVWIQWLLVLSWLLWQYWLIL
jgi:hypothetical protein